MADNNSTTNAASDATASAKSGEATSISGSTSGAPAQPSNPENAVSKVQAAASPSPATVAQDLYDRVHADFQAVTAKLAEVSAERDEAKAYASNLSEQLASKTEEAEKAASAVQSKVTTVYADAASEAEWLTTEIHDLLADAKVKAARLADLVPATHPARAVESAVASFIQKVREHI